MPELIGCADRKSWSQAGKFAAKVLGNVKLRSLEDVRDGTPVGTIRVYLTDPDYKNVKLPLTGLKSGSPNVVIYFANCRPWKTRRYLESWWARFVRGTRACFSSQSRGGFRSGRIGNGHTGETAISPPAGRDLFENVLA